MEKDDTLDEMVATKVMGWSRMAVDDERKLTPYWHDMTGAEVRLAEDGETPAWSPSSNLNDAWDVIKALESRDVFLRNMSRDNFYGFEKSTKYSCQFAGRIAFGATGRTPMEAISYASIKGAYELEKQLDLRIKQLAIPDVAIELLNKNYTSEDIALQPNWAGRG